MKKYRTFLDQQELRLRWAERRLSRLLKENEHLKEIAYYDGLTRESAVLSRYGFIERLQGRLTEVDERNRRGETRQTGFLYIDLNDFKAVNDQYGHDAGDAVIRAFAQAVQDVLRGSDILGRLGGDEFAVLARVRGEDGLHRLKTRVQQAIAIASVIHKGVELSVRASIGMTILTPGDNVRDILVRADRLMYEDKSFQKRRL
jgi:diguanylate cyclase (GGDEF)-like protein